MERSLGCPAWEDKVYLERDVGPATKMHIGHCALDRQRFSKSNPGK